MNFTKKLIAVGAITLAATFANAQTSKTDAVDKITLTAIVPNLARIKVVPKAYTDNSWIWYQTLPATLPTMTTVTGSDPKLIGTVLVETNMAQWDVVVTSKNKGALVNSDASPAKLKAITSGTTTAEVRVQIYSCFGNSDAGVGPGASTPPSTTCTLPASALTTSTGRADSLAVATGSSLCKSLGKTNGFMQSDMGAAGASEAASMLGNGTSDKPAKVAHLGIYAGLYNNTTVINEGKLVPTGTDPNYQEELSFSLVSKY